LAIFREPVCGGSELFFESTKHFLGAAQHARDVGTDGYYVPPDGPKLEHRIKAGRAENFCRGNSYELGYFFYRFGANPSVLLLG
jgi:hypothetical protein